MAEVQIKHVKNNIDKQRTYKEQLGRYSKAMNEGFYFEALLITYSMLEDRLKSFLYYCGFFDNKSTLSLSNKTKADIISISFDDIPNKLPSLNSISTKIQYVEGLVKWANTSIEAEMLDNLYLCKLKEQLEYLDIDALLKYLSNLKDWCKYRNEIMHASMNKNIDNMYEGLAKKVAEGMEIARFIDSQDKLLKKHCVVRKCLKMMNE